MRLTAKALASVRLSSPSRRSSKYSLIFYFSLLLFFPPRGIYNRPIRKIGQCSVTQNITNCRRESGNTCDSIIFHSTVLTMQRSIRHVERNLFNNSKIFTGEIFESNPYACVCAYWRSYSTRFIPASVRLQVTSDF